MLKAGCGQHEIIGALAFERDLAIQRVAELEIIAPRKYRTQEGKLMILHCPDHLVPESKTYAAEEEVPL